MKEYIKEFKILALMSILFLLAFFLPVENITFQTALIASLDLIKWYAREHVVLCLLIAFFIAGIISVFFSQDTILKYLGGKARKIVAYTVASVSGAILAVCSCTILPLFTSIYKKGAGLGPAISFLFSGPAINIMAIILSMKILGFELGLARLISAVVFSIISGIIMEFIFYKEEKNRQKEFFDFVTQQSEFKFYKTAIFFFTMVFILIFANWGFMKSTYKNIFTIIYNYKWYITVIFTMFLWFILYKFFKVRLKYVIISALILLISILLTIIFLSKDKLSPILPVLTGIVLLSWITLKGATNWVVKSWIIESWNYAKLIMPLLGIGVLIAGFLLGSKHDNVYIKGIIPDEWVNFLIGGNSIFSVFFASVIGAFMYFATLTEVPIVMGLLSMGMGKGPALAMLLAGPSLSLPNMLVIRKVLGTKKTLTYVLIVIILSTITGYIYGNLL